MRLVQLRGTSQQAFGVVCLLASCCSPALSADAGPVRIPFTLFQGNIVVQMSLPSGETLLFIFDSGLSKGNIVSATTAKSLRLESKDQAHMTDSTGNQSVAVVAELSQIAIGGAVPRSRDSPLRWFRMA